MAKLSVLELKALLARAEESEESHVVISVPEDQMRERSNSSRSLGSDGDKLSFQEGTFISSQVVSQFNFFLLLQQQTLHRIYVILIHQPQTMCQGEVQDKKSALL